MTIAVLGAGAWGTALAAVMAGDGTPVRLWGRDGATIEAIERRRENPRYLPGIALPDMMATTRLETALDGADLALLVVPVKATREVARAVLDRAPQIALVCCSKGLEAQTGETPAVTVERLAPRAPVAALSGPSFARDVAAGLPTAVTLACPALDDATALAARLSRPRLRLYAHDDRRGVELGGALKNVMAIAVGAARGLGLGASAEAAVVARGFDELVRISTTLGARRETLNGLSGLGDLVLSCASPQSRNFAYGLALGEGRSTDGMPLAEGARSAASAARVSRRHGLDCAIVEGVDRMLRGAVRADALVEELLSRPLKRESASAGPGLSG